MENLPYDIQAESGIIATLIHIPEYVLHSEHLKPEYFYVQENKCFYWAIWSLYTEDKVDKIDSFNLMTKISSNTGVKNIINSLNLGSVQEFIDLSTNVARDTVEEYKLLVGRVVALSFKRDLYKKLQIFSNKALDEKEDNLGKLSNLIYGDLSALGEKYIVNENIRMFGDVIDDIWLSIQQKKSGGKFNGVPSKYDTINKYCPYEKSELIIVAAPRKTGKSMILMNEFWHKAKNNVPSSYFDTEMSSRNFTERLLSHITQIPVHKIKQGTYTETEEAMLKEAVVLIKSKPLVHIYNPMMTNEQIYSTCKILQNKMGLQFVIYDYLKSNEKDSSSQYNDLGNKTNFLKNEIAGSLNLSVVAGAQLNRKNEIGDSYKIEQYASTIINIRPKTNDEIATDGVQCGNYAATIKLNRNGEQMGEDEYLDFRFNGNTATIEEAAPHVKQELQF